MRTSALVLSGLLLLGAGAVGGQEPGGALQAVGCRELVLAGESEAAVETCHRELAEAPGSRDLIRLTARAEYEAGDPLRAAELWQRVLDGEGWSAEAARGRALALWRGARVDQAEALLAEVLERSPDLEAHEDMVGFLLSFDRWDEAAAAAERAVAAYPDHCDFLEEWGLAEAGRERDDGAAKLFEKAVASGCPEFRWASRGVMPARVGEPAYRALLEPAALVADLEKLTDRECLQRFELLRMVNTPAVAAAVTAQVLGRSTAQVRLSGLGLLADLGADALSSWAAILASDDFILRKHALRRMRELRDPAFESVLFQHLEREELSGNRSLTLLALGEILLDSDRAGRGEALLRSIPKDDDLYPVALLSLVDCAESRGDHTAALALVEEVRTAAPGFRVDPELVDRLRALSGEGDAAP